MACDEGKEDEKGRLVNGWFICVYDFGRSVFVSTKVLKEKLAYGMVVVRDDRRRR